MKTIGINIDGILRNFHNQFDKQYRKIYIHNPSLVGVDEETHSFREFTKEEEEDFDKKIQEKERDLITLPVDSFELLNHYKFDSKAIKMSKLDIKDGVDYTPIDLTPKENLEVFIETYSHALFTLAEEYPGAIDSINKLQFLGKESGQFDVVLLSTLKSKAISATYSFLGNYNCRIRTIKFLESDSEKWNHCDVLVDIMPSSFQTKPKDKISIKINHLFNQWDAADFSYDSIKQICNKEFLERLFKDNQ